MSTTNRETGAECALESAPADLVALKERVAGQPSRVRRELEPLIDEVMEHAYFRSRVIWIAREAIERLRIDLAATRFDLEATRRERDARGPRGSLG